MATMTITRAMTAMMIMAFFVFAGWLLAVSPEVSSVFARGEVA